VPVVRRLVWLWIAGPLSTNTRLGAQRISDISGNLCALRNYMPCEFARKPRSLVCWQRWKATEFRQFLLYTGPVVLVGKVSDAVYNNFMLLSVGIFLLLDVSSSPQHIDYAEELIVLFVKHYSDLYGANMVVYNVHNLIHLCDDRRKYGPLDNVSAFCFENSLGKLVTLIRKPSKPLEQLVRRFMEQREFRTKILQDTLYNVAYSSSWVPKELQFCRQYKCVRVKNALISIQTGNNCLGTGDDIILVKI
jgi:hypothetical protein